MWCGQTNGKTKNKKWWTTWTDRRAEELRLYSGGVHVGWFANNQDGESLALAAPHPNSWSRSTLATLQHSLALDLGLTQQGKGHNLGLPLSIIMDTCTGGIQVLCECTGLTSFSNYLLWGRAHTQGQQSLIKADPQGFYINNWRAGLPLTGQRSYRAERKSHLTPCTGFRAPQHQPYPLSRAQQPAHPEERGGWHPFWNQPLHQRYWTHTVYTGTLPHKNTPWRPQWGNCFS